MVTVADYAALSAASYGSSTVDGWQAIQTRSDPATGFSATLFQNSNGDLVLAFAGTNPVSLADWSNSINAMTTGTHDLSRFFVAIQPVSRGSILSASCRA